MSLYLAPWNNSIEPNQGNVKQYLTNLYSKFQPVEQVRWNEANIDTHFYGGTQNFINQPFGSGPNNNNQNWYFNICQQPINMITGYERQHRKGFMYQSVEGGDDKTSDQYTKLIAQACALGDIHEQKSKAKELSAISGMVLAQPYLDYTGDDQAQGTLKIKIWEYNSFLIDPYFRSPDASDAQFVWCQEYISKQEAENRFPDKIEQIGPMSGTPQRYGSFYFLPENYNMARNDLMVLSYVWYKWKTKKKRLYSRTRNQFFDFSGGQENLENILYNIPDMEVVTVDTPCWKLAVVLNDQLMFQGENPLGFSGCPCIPYFWNYEPHQNHFDLRSRGLIRTMRSSQYLMNYKIIQNNDIAAATINAGWKRKVGAVANEDNLKKAGQGWDVLVNEGYEMTDVEKIIPSAVPESDLALADQMRAMIYETCGINLENWSGQNDKQISSLTLLMKQAANLMVFQKYFDQWDYSDKLIGDRLMQIALNNWNAAKVELMIGEEPTPYFHSKVFSKFQVVVEESDLTATQQNLQAQQMMEINQQFQREVFSPSMIIPKLNITGKGELVPFLKKQEEQMQHMQQEQSQVQHLVEDAKIKELYSRATANIAMAKERAGRFDANVGLLEERLSNISKNQSLSTKAKMEALEKLVMIVQSFGELEAIEKMGDIDRSNQNENNREDEERMKAQQLSEGSRFLQQIMGDMMPQQAQGQEEEQMQAM